MPFGIVGYSFALQMSDRFTVSSTCNSAVVDTLLLETIDLANNAIASIDTLLAAKVALNARLGSSQVAALMRAANTAWGVAEPTAFTFSLSTADRLQLTTAQSKTPLLANQH